MQLPNVPGLGFYPTNEQLLLVYLRKRILEHSSSSSSPYSTNAHIIPDIDLYRWKPWDLPREIERLSPLGSCSRDEWYFFCKNPSEKRKVGNVGHWKVMGKVRKMRSETTEEAIGSMKSLVFYRGGSCKTNWVIHECHLNPSCLEQQMPFVVCCLYKNGTQKDDYDHESASQQSESSSSRS